MLAELTTFLKPAPAAPPIRDPESAGELYRHWRVRILYASLIGYALFYFVRKNLSLAMPAIEHDLGISKSSLGIFLTLHGILYGVSKFANGFMGDRCNARTFMALGLACSAIVNIGFGASSSVAGFGAFWLLNGWFQGMGFPPCARSLTHWFAARERGTKFAIWNTSHSIGAALALVTCSGLVLYSWRLCFFVPAALGLVGAIFLLDRLRDTPQSLGLPPVDESPGLAGSDPGSAELDGPAFRQFVLRRVLLNPMIWVISLANFFVYTVRGSILDWGPTLLKEAKHMQLQHTGWVVASCEVAGVMGMLASGWLTDRVFAGRGGRACAVSMMLCGVCIFLFWKLPAQSPLVSTALLSGVGFFLYGPQCLVGVIAANVATRRAAATAIGVTGFFGYLSGILSGWGLGRIVERGGWEPGFRVIFAASLVAAVLFAIAWNTDHAATKALPVIPIGEEVELRL